MLKLRYVGLSVVAVIILMCKSIPTDNHQPTEVLGIAQMWVPACVPWQNTNIYKYIYIYICL